MEYAHDPRTFLFSHYIYRGLRSATGVIGTTLVAMQFMDLPSAMVVSVGALCTSLMDLPSPLNHKFNEMLASATKAVMAVHSSTLASISLNLWFSGLGRSIRLVHLSLIHI